MTTKERLHRLVDELSEQEADATLEFIASRREEAPAEGDDEEMLAGHEAAIERLRADPEQWAAWQVEVAEFDGTLGDGLDHL